MRFRFLLPGLCVWWTAGCSGPAGAPTGDVGVEVGVEVDAADVSIAAPACPAVYDPLESGSLQLRPHTVSLLITVLGADRGAPVGTARLDSPLGSLVPSGWWQDASFDLCLECPNRVRIDRGLHSVLAPNAPAAEALFTDGEWLFEARDPLGGARVAALALQSDGPPLTGRLTLAVHLTGAGGAGAEATVGAAVEQVRALYEPAGLAVRAAFYPAPLPGLDVVAEDLDLHVFSHHAGGPDEVPVYLVEGLAGPEGTALLGLSPLPGPAGELVSSSGVVIEVSAPSLGLVLAHELGHYLGLWHTWEPGAPQIKDPLSDTPVVGQDNLMAPGTPGSELSIMQAAVMRGHPIVRHDCPGP